MTVNVTFQTLRGSVVVLEIPRNLTRSSFSSKVGGCKEYNINEAGFHHRDLFENLKEKILAKLSFF